MAGIPGSWLCFCHTWHYLVHWTASNLLSQCAYVYVCVCVRVCVYVCVGGIVCIKCSTAELTLLVRSLLKLEQVFQGGGILD